jgi:hypothetical protein
VSELQTIKMKLSQFLPAVAATVAAVAACVATAAVSPGVSAAACVGNVDVICIPFICSTFHVIHSPRSVWKKGHLLYIGI